MTSPGVLDVTVLVCSRERPGHLADLVDSVLAGDHVPAEIVVVDQSAAPHPTLAVPDPERPVRYLHRPGRGLSRARNQGFRAARRDVVVVVDDDMFVDPDWLAELVGGREPGDPSRVVTTGRVLAAPLEPGQHPLPAAALITIEEPLVFRGRQPRDVVPGANVSLPRQLVLHLGGYDERLGAGSSFGGAEDNDLGLRLLDAGCEVRHVPAAVVRHRGRDHAGDERRTRWEYGRGKGALHAKHLRDRQVTGRLVRDLARRARRLAVHGWRDRSVAEADLLHLGGLATGFAQWFLGRHGRRR